MPPAANRRISISRRFSRARGPPEIAGGGDNEDVGAFQHDHDGLLPEWIRIDHNRPTRSLLHYVPSLLD